MGTSKGPAGAALVAVCLVALMGAAVGTAEVHHVRTDAITSLPEFKLAVRHLEGLGYTVDGMHKVYNLPKALHEHAVSHAELLQLEAGTFPSAAETEAWSAGKEMPGAATFDGRTIPARTRTESKNQIIEGAWQRIAGSGGYTPVTYLGAGTFGGAIKVTGPSGQEVIKFNLAKAEDRTGRHTWASSQLDMAMECKYMLAIRDKLLETGGLSSGHVMYANDFKKADLKGYSGETVNFGFCFMPIMGGDLVGYIKTEINPDPKKSYNKARIVTQQLVSGVAWLRKHMGEVHCDLKPGNVFYESEEELSRAGATTRVPFPGIFVRIADFGGDFMISEARSYAEKTCNDRGKAYMWLTSAGYQSQWLMGKLLAASDAAGTPSGSTPPHICVETPERQPLWALAAMAKELVCGSGPNNGRNIPIYHGYLVSDLKAASVKQMSWLESLWSIRTDTPANTEDYLFTRFIQRMTMPCDCLSPKIGTFPPGLGKCASARGCAVGSKSVAFQQAYITVEGALEDEWISSYRGEIAPPTTPPSVCTIMAQ